MKFMCQNKLKNEKRKLENGKLKSKFINNNPVARRIV